MKDTNQLKILFRQYIDGEISQEDETTLFDFFSSADEHEIREVMGEGFASQPPADLSMLDEPSRIIFDKIKQQTYAPGIKVNLWRYVAAAAVVLIIGTYLFMHNKQSLPSTDEQFIASDFGADRLPGNNRATLTLKDGRRINLDDVAVGEISVKDGIKISKTEDGIITYELTEGRGAGYGYNTISTPRGGQYRVILPDRSSVLLNAASSLKYPERFGSSDRRVELSGEGFFEITADRNKPFIVQTQGQQVKVLGTRFNVNSYSDEPATVTTLQEGSVEVLTADSKVARKLVPGQRAVNRAGKISVENADMGSDLAWTENMISFQDARIDEILRQASRWYNIDVVYRRDVSTETFSGGISRQSRLSSLLKVLELSGVKFTVEKNDKGYKLLVE